MNLLLAPLEFAGAYADDPPRTAYDVHRACLLAEPLIADACPEHGMRVCREAADPLTDADEAVYYARMRNEFIFVPNVPVEPGWPTTSHDGRRRVIVVESECAWANLCAASPDLERFAHVVSCASGVREAALDYLYPPHILSRHP